MCIRDRRRNGQISLGRFRENTGHPPQSLIFLEGAVEIQGGEGSDLLAEEAGAGDVALLRFEGAAGGELDVAGLAFDEEAVEMCIRDRARTTAALLGA